MLIASNFLERCNLKTIWKFYLRYQKSISSTQYFFKIVETGQEYIFSVYFIFAFLPEKLIWLKCDLFCGEIRYVFCHPRCTQSWKTWTLEAAVIKDRCFLICLWVQVMFPGNFEWSWWNYGNTFYAEWNEDGLK